MTPSLRVHESLMIAARCSMPTFVLNEIKSPATVIQLVWHLGGLPEGLAEEQELIR